MKEKEKILTTEKIVGVTTTVTGRIKKIYFTHNYVMDVEQREIFNLYRKSSKHKVSPETVESAKRLVRTWRKNWKGCCVT